VSAPSLGSSHWVPAWVDLDETQRALARRFMECFAAFLSYTDSQLGRLVAFLEVRGELENTAIILVSDNGASAEGGPDGSINDVRLHNLDPAGVPEMYAHIDEIGGPLTHNNYPWGWTMAGNTPFRRWKREVHEGGVADPCIVSWPGGLPGVGGGIRHQFAHAIDVMPTVLDLVGIEAPEEIDYVPQTEVDGVSFRYLLGSGGVDEPGRHLTQHFEMLGSRALYHDGWKAVTFHPVGPMYDDGLEPKAPFDDDVWELYDVTRDISESNDLAGEYPEKVAEMVEMWWDEAARNQVLPLDNRVLLAILHPRPDRRRPRTIFQYYPNVSQVPEPVAVNVRNRSHKVTVEAELPEGAEAEGVLIALGSALGGWSLHLRAGRLRYIHNLYGKRRYVIEAGEAVSGGARTFGFEFEKQDGLGGAAKLLVDGRLAAEGEIRRFTPSGFNGVGAGLTCGYEWGPAIGDDYAAPFRFNGLIRKAVVEVTGPVVRDPLAEVAAILSEQ
jgi:Sulfatase